MANIDAIQATENWVKRVVIALNFCPFAKREAERKSIRYQTCQHDNTQASLQAFMEEVFLLDQDPSIETSLLIFTGFLADFEDFLDFVDLSSTLLGQSGYDGIYQVATFHPDYCFADQAPEDAANYTNRSPYPTLHLLREASLERVLKTYSAPEAIPPRNIAYSTQMGAHALQALLHSCRSD